MLRNCVCYDVIMTLLTKLDKVVHVFMKQIVIHTRNNNKKSTNTTKVICIVILKQCSNLCSLMPKVLYYFCTFVVLQTSVQICKYMFVHDIVLCPSDQSICHF